MWLVIHFYMIFLLRPNFAFHFWSGIVFLIYCLLHQQWEKKMDLKVLTSTLGLFFMYLGIFVYNSPIQFSYLPYYVISTYGFRGREGYIIIGSIITGLHLYYLSVPQILAHVSCNVGRLMKTTTMPSFSFFAVHWAMSILMYYTDGNTDTSESMFIKNLIGAVSSLMSFYFDRYDATDLFSICMMFSSLSTWEFFKVIVIQIYESDWLCFLENNHYMMVQKSFSFIVPLGLLIFCLFH